MINLKGKTAIVSGGARDIGQAVVLELVRCGAQVAFSHHGSSASATLTAAEKLGGRVIGHPMDAQNSQSIAQFAERACADLGKPVDILVNVVGGLIARKNMAEMDETFWDQVMDVNVKSTFLLTKAVLPKM